jgi:hypothetical protein
VIPRPVGAAAIIVALAALVMLAEPPERAVLAPMVAQIMLLVVFCVLVLRGRGQAHVDEIGVWYIGILAVYGVLPLAVYLFLGFEYTILNDNRLFALKPAPDAVEQIGWLYVQYMAAFGFAYVLTRPRREGLLPPLVRIRTETVTAAVGLWLIAAGLLWLPGLFFDLRAVSYMDEYRLIQTLPLGSRQVMKVAGGIRSVLTVLLLVWLFSRYSRTRWWIAGLLAVQFTATLVLAGSRTELMVTFAACAILYHRFVSPIKVRAAIIGGTAGVTVFLALGVLRTLRNVEETGPFSLGVSAGEFEGLFANAVDLEDRRQRNEFDPVGPSLALSDLVAPIPSQMLPFPKRNPSEWYLDTFYPDVAARGGGMAFGVVSQAIIGRGRAEMIIRGLLVGVLFALTTRFYRSRADRPWVVVFNVWMIVWAYQSFRATTFYVLAMFFQFFIPAVVMVEIGRRILAGAATSHRPGTRLAKRSEPAHAL